MLHTLYLMTWLSSLLKLLFSCGALAGAPSFSFHGHQTPPEASFTITPPAPADMVQRDVFTSSENGYHCFRRPALLYTSNGTLLAFAEGHSTSCADSDTEGVVIVVKRSNDGGITWSPLSLVISGPTGMPIKFCV